MLHEPATPSKATIEHLERAIKAGTDDEYLLSAIYSQLGNAYYSLKDYRQARNYHFYDVVLTGVMKDVSQQAKAHVNLSLSYTMLNCFEQAVKNGNTVLAFAQQLDDEALLGRAYYVLGVAYLQRFTKTRSSDAEDATGTLQEAIDYFNRMQAIAEKREDETSRAIAIGNLANAHYYLGQYEKAIFYHSTRLEIARGVGDKTCMRRCYSNIGNAYILLGFFDDALESYSKAMEIAKEQGRKSVEAQISFSMGNTEALRNKHDEAVTFHLNHLRIARALGDSAGEVRANSSLANDFLRLNEYRKALYYLVRNYTLAKKLDDDSVMVSVVSEIRAMLQQNASKVVEDGHVLIDCTHDPDVISVGDLDTSTTSYSTLASAANFTGMQAPSTSLPNLTLSTSLECLILEYANSTSNSNDSSGSSGGGIRKPGADSAADCGLSRAPLTKSLSEVKQNGKADPEDFFDILTRMQSRRIDDQRCEADLILKDRTNDVIRQSDALHVSSHRNTGRFSLPRLTSGNNILKAVRNRVKRGGSGKRPFGTPDFSSTPLPVKSYTLGAMPDRSVSIRPISFASDGSASTTLSPVRESPIPRRNTPVREPHPPRQNNPDAILDLIANIQGRRMEEQRAHLDMLPGLNNREKFLRKHRGEAKEGETEDLLDERLYDLILESQADRLDDQRSTLGGRKDEFPETIPEDDVSELVLRMQAGRLDEQRATFKPE
ncbi:G-protein signaling modulator [Aphelenchoides avenae]|nr:G-protein signaling modulator [Aphelenchus avenae]